MNPRFDYSKASPGAINALFQLEVYLHHCGLNHRLLHLIKLRASQINGCAYCIDIHSKDARAAGDSEERLYLLNAWRDSPLYTDQERAALAWTEAVTKVTDGHVADDVYEEVKQHFSPRELTDLTLAIGAINAWNRMAISFRAVPGNYQVGQYKQLLERKVQS